MFVHTVFHLTCLNVVDCLCHIHGNGTALGVGHQAFGSQNLTHTAYKSIMSGGGNHHVKSKPVFLLDFFDVLFRTHEIGTCRCRFVCLCALGNYQNTHGFTCSVGQHNHTTNLLVCVTAVYAQFNVQFKCFVKFCRSNFNAFSIASAISYCFVLSYFFKASTYFFPFIGASLVFNNNAHAACRSCNHGACRFNDAAFKSTILSFAISSI